MTTARTRRPRGPKLRQALEDAQGQSEWVIVVVADIRGFSAFSQRRESPDVAMYIKRVYMRLIDDYFPGATFYKATGDGLLMTVRYEERNLKEKAQQTVENCLRCLREFAEICSGDPMVNFPAPDKIGFGIARGTTCCLVSRGTILDYSGHLLNLATRLMDLARPSGIVLDGGVELGLLDDDTAQLFEPHDVYVRSVAEAEPTRVYVLKGVVQIPEEAKRPIALEQWETVEVPTQVKQWKAYLPQRRVRLPKPVKRPDGVRVDLRHQRVRGGKVVPGILMTSSFTDFRVEVLGNEYSVVCDVNRILQYARSNKLRQDATLTALVYYVPQ